LAEQDVLKKAEMMYAQLVDVYPQDPRFLEQYIQILFKLDKLEQVRAKLRKLNAMYDAAGEREKMDALVQRYGEFSHAATFSGNAKLEASGFLAAIEGSLLDRLILRLRKVHLKAGDYLFRKGELSRSMYVVVQGEVLVMCQPAYENEKPVMLNRLKRGDIVGEMAMFSGKPRSADVLANSDADFFEITQAMLTDVFAKEPTARNNMIREMRMRHRVSILSNNQFFAHLPLPVRRRLAERSKERNYAIQSSLFEGGVLLTEVLIITQGEVQYIYRDARNLAHTLESMYAGDLMGEMCLLKNQGTLGDTVAATEVEVLAIPIHAAQDVVAAYPKLREQLIAYAEHKTSQMMLRTQELSKTFDWY